MCLEALARQTLPASDFEVIVVVDGSTDNTSEMLDQLVTPYSIKILHQANSGQNVARNYGAAHAIGNILIFLDDDIFAEPQLVAEHNNLHKTRGKVVGIGQIPIQIVGTDWFISRFANGWNKHYRELNDGLRQPDWTDGFSGNISIPRLSFNEVGGFADDILPGEDIELAYRLQNHGLTMVYLPQAIGLQNEHKTV
jgi:glycosyltransferase involved in cell wall biosynthesis